MEKFIELFDSLIQVCITVILIGKYHHIVCSNGIFILENMSKWSYISIVNFLKCCDWPRPWNSSKSITQEYKTYPKIQVNSSLFKLAQTSSNFLSHFSPIRPYYNVSSVTQASNNHIPFIELWMTVAVRILNILIIKEERKIRGHISKLQVWRWYFAEKSHAQSLKRKKIYLLMYQTGLFQTFLSCSFFTFLFSVSSLHTC